MEKEVTTERVYNTVVIKSCTCVHEQQDKLYGKGRRVYNKAGNVGKTFFRCTVCGREQT